MSDSYDAYRAALEADYYRDHPIIDYPPFYTAPTPRFGTPEPEYAPEAASMPANAPANTPAMGAYPTPDASPDVKSKYKKLPEGEESQVMYEQACRALEEYKSKRADADADKCKGKSNANGKGSSGYKSTKMRGSKSSRKD